MSFTKLSYDKEAYKTAINESIKPGSYYLNKPRIDCQHCYPYPVSVVPQEMGNSLYSDKSMVDVSSELLGLTRKASDDPKKQYIPTCGKDFCDSGYPCGGGVIDKCKGERPDDKGLVHFKDCFIPAEETRTTNPACNLRGTGWNRWEWLCTDPQKNIEMPFSNNVSNRIIFKDNHRPSIPNPMDQTSSLPPNAVNPCNELDGSCAAKFN